ncbi:lysoplasmalogenase [Ferrovibrio sp.]|uniref:lysoplasmalogenase n=1 Tax=Ferrovibrio sp. TaxID=1917215 RepID=UPI0026219315|nr:lysoplasmalogenase [Ferrovibrio sp.]
MTSAARQTASGAPFLFRGAFGAALGLAILYLFAGPLLPDILWLKAAVKGAVCPLLAVALWASRGGDADAKRLGLALLFSAAGDVFLAVDRVGLFVPGLASFLLAHLVYLWQFVARRPRPMRLPVLRRLVALGILAGITIMLALLTPGLGKLLASVYAYIAAIAAMALAATALPGRPLVMLGAISFMVSDSLIALDKFVAPIPFVGPAIWITYVAAQVMIVLGWKDRA